MGILIQSRAAASELRPRSSMQRQAEIAEMRPSCLGVRTVALCGCKFRNFVRARRNL